MNEQALQQEALQILQKNRVGTLATMKGDQPFVRYMIFRNEKFTLYTVSSKNTAKVEDIKKNNKVHILIGFEGGGYGKPYLDITAVASIHDDKELKDKLWHENFRKYLDGPDDPNYIVIRCEPITVRVMNHPDLQGPQTINLLQKDE